MNYEDELERARAKRSRKRTSTTTTGTGTRSSAGTHGSTRTTGSAGSQESGYTSRSTRSTSARSGQHSSYRRGKKKNARAKKIAIGAALAIVLVIAVVGIAVFAYINHQWGKLQPTEFSKTAVQNESIPLDLREKMQKGYWTVAVFGVDSRDGSLVKGNQSDVIMIANLNRSTGEIKLVSVYRDTYLNINDRNNKPVVVKNDKDEYVKNTDCKYDDFVVTKTTAANTGYVYVEKITFDESVGDANVAYVVNVDTVLQIGK